MKSISCAGICGEEDFGCQPLKKAILPAGKAGDHQVEKSRYVLGISPWLGMPEQKSSEKIEKLMTGYQKSH